LGLIFPKATTFPNLIAYGDYSPVKPWRVKPVKLQTLTFHDVFGLRRFANGRQVAQLPEREVCVEDTVLEWLQALPHFILERHIPLLALDFKCVLI
jgi:hypothetical protein